jgi:CDGSH-type Zn-finger protein
MATKKKSPAKTKKTTKAATAKVQTEATAPATKQCGCGDTKNPAGACDGSHNG